LEKLGVYNEMLLTIEYKQSTKVIIFFFYAKKESKSHWASPQTTERFKIYLELLPCTS